MEHEIKQIDGLYFLDFADEFTNLNNGKKTDISRVIHWVNENSIGTFTDWVLPDRYTLSLSALILEDNRNYWSSTSSNYAYFAWYVDFDVGYVSQCLRSTKYAVRLVRKTQMRDIVMVGFEIHYRR